MSQLGFTKVHSSCCVLVLQGAFKVENPNEVKVRWVGSWCNVLCDKKSSANLKVGLYFDIALDMFSCHYDQALIQWVLGPEYACLSSCRSTVMKIHHEP